MEQTPSAEDNAEERERLEIRRPGGGGGEAQIRLIPVSLANIPWGTAAPVDLYQHVGQELSLLFRRGQTLTAEAYGEIAGHTDKLYHDKEAEVNWDVFVDTNLPEILKLQLPIETKAEIAYGSITRTTQKIFEEFTEEGYKQAEISVDVLNHLVEEPKAFESFFQLTVHDYYTYTHSVHVYLYSSLLTRAVIGSENAPFLYDLGVGYLLHDIGKKDISLQILNKTGPLNDEEWAIIKKHPEVGFGLLTQASGGLSEEVTEIVLQHHEWCDGSGYPNGLKEYEVGRYSKICAIADMFDALTTNRSYQKAVSKLDALTIMKDSPGHLDEKLLTRFIQL